MNYNLFQAEDFAADESFIAYYLKTEESSINFWENWISRHPEKIDEIFNAEQILALMYLRLPEDELHFEAIRFDNFLTSKKSEKFLRKKEFNFSKSFILFSSVAILMALFFAVLYFYPNTETITYVTKHNGYGKISILDLSDGTKITLNANSTIKLPKVFGSKKREVFLIGEAFFEVSKDKSRPFTVNANGTKTVVLGTKFNVSAYGTKPDVSVALIEGSIEISANAGRDKMLLRPSEMATFFTKNKTLIRTGFDQHEVTSWRTGQIIFRNANFKTIAEKLKNSYGIKLIDQSNMKDWNYSGEFEKADYITIIKSICFAENITYEQTNQTIKLKQKK
ncbi:FecR family protein [Pedobacter mendelii]|uniref:FecR family protein n=1 Tax=Pedobacter mendelii TaxID=1908240 RepID=A0ABQ2BD56_9SPHI|nr:FecR family protein [Pedobacter mendelii]GGI23379.1 hypothetical protein GCM10008119_07350 [Pedobacter mendelii]